MATTSKTERPGPYHKEPVYGLAVPTRHDLAKLEVSAVVQSGVRMPEALFRAITRGKRPWRDHSGQFSILKTSVMIGACVPGVVMTYQ